MAFLSPPGYPMASRQPTQRTFPEAVDRLLRACGIRDTVTIESPTKHVAIALQAVNDALERIWTAARWDWRIKLAILEMETARGAYELPDDWAAPAMAPLNSNPESSRATPLLYADYERLGEKYPRYAAFTSTQMGDLSGDVSAVVKISNDITGDESLAGRPKYWSIHGQHLFLFPMPWEAAYDATGSDTFYNDSRWFFPYFTRHFELTTDTDVIPLPYDFLHIHHFLALAYFKQGIEYPDFQADEARAERLLNVARIKNKQVYLSKYAVEPAYMPEGL